MTKQNGVVQSLFFKFTERVSVKLIGFIISIVLARLLDPKVFGLLAILQVFINISQVFVQGGLNVALIQNKDTNDEDYSTVFWISLCISIIIYVILFITAPIIGQYYDSSELINPLRVLSVCMIFGALNSVQTAKLSRNMQFGKQMVCNLVATIVSGITGVFLAYKGFGIWALVLYNVAQQISVCIVMFCVTRWYPKLVFSKQRAIILFAYGWKILISNVLFSLYTDIRSLIIGKAYSVDELAIYDRGNQLPNIISYNLDTAVQSVMLPVLSRNQSHIESVRSNLSKMIRIMTYIVSPIMIGLAAVAKPLVLVLLTEKWASCVPYMMIFCGGYIFAPISSSCNVAIKAIGRSDVFAKCQAVRMSTLLLMLIIPVTMFHSVYAIVVFYVIGMFLETIIAALPVQKYIGYSLGDLLKDVLPVFFVSMFMGIASYLVTTMITNCFLSLSLGVIIGVVVYLFLSFIFKIKAFVECRELVKRLFVHED